MNTSCDKSRSVKLPTQKRIDSIDLFKGIAILGIVWKHTFHPQWCDLIHISALFFILSGIFFKDEPFIPFLKKKIRTILIPFLFFYILSYLARMAFYFGHFRTLHGFAWDSLLEIFSISNTPDYLTVNIPLWFLVGLFVMQIIFWCLNRVIPRNKYRSCWFLVILAALYAGYGTIESWHSPFMFNIAIECLPYFIAGNLFGLQIARFLSKSSLKYLLAPTCFALFIGFQYLPIDISILAFIKALTIFLAILSLLSCFENSCSMIWTTVRYFGKSSLFIMGIHVLLLAPIQSMASAITGKPNLLTGLICLALTMLLIYVLIPFTEKYIPWAIGRQRQKQDTKLSQTTK